MVQGLRQYDGSQAWQYAIRVENLEDDLKQANLTSDETENLRVSDFEFSHFTKESEDYSILFPEVKAFIERHEWLGRLSNYPSHFFTARYKGILAGVVVMDVPSAFSNLLGAETRQLERLISRGACVSWSPKNLASSLIMYAIKTAVQNTPYRIFTAYSDTEAKELGTIYQACNFVYLGQTSGAKKQYRYPGTEKWFSDRSFRSRSAYKRYAKALGIAWDSTWQNGDSIIWTAMPSGVERQLREESKRQYNICESRDIAPKHKYCYILGRGKKDTKRLREKFFRLNPEYPMPYPKER